MRRFLALTFMTFIFSLSYGQKLHSFLFCNTFDPTIGTSARFNYVEMHDQFQLLAGALMMEYKEYSCTGSFFEISRISSELNKASITENDIVVLYINTHGFIKETDNVKFPNLTIPDSIVSAYVKHELMLKKKPKLLLTIIEACSGFLNLSSQQAFVFEQNISSVAPKPLNQRQINNVRTLFANPFKVIITAGEAGKNTYATSLGSIFTKCFLIALNECINLPAYRVSAELNWDKVLTQTKIYTENRTRGMPISYSPVWETRELIGFVEQGVFNSVPAEERDVDFVVKTRKRLFFQRNDYVVEMTIHNRSKLAIDSVVYYLHETMPKPVVKTTNAARNFIHTITVWGRFPLKAKVYFNDGKNYELYKDFNFVEMK